jgi:DNA-binding transcriptional regulator YiaG
MHYSVSDGIKQLRQELGGISQEHFARELGVSTRTVSRWEKGDYLNARTLSLMRNIALRIRHRTLARFFEEEIRRNLHWVLK